MLLCNLENIPDRKYEILGLVSKMDYDKYGTEPAVEMLQQEAEKLNADAIINIKFNISTYEHMPVIIASGTAIKFLE